MKSGFKTTEFIMAAVVSILGLLVAAGVLSPAESTEIQNASAQVIQAVADLVAVLAPVLSVIVYTWSRTRVKQVANGTK